MLSPEYEKRNRRLILILKLLLLQPFLVLGITFACCASPGGREYGQLCTSLSCLCPFVGAYVASMLLGLFEYMTRRERIVLPIVAVLGVIAWLGALFFTIVVDA